MTRGEVYITEKVKSRCTFVVLYNVKGLYKNNSKNVQRKYSFFSFRAKVWNFKLRRIFNQHNVPAEAMSTYCPAEKCIIALHQHA